MKRGLLLFLLFVLFVASAQPALAATFSERVGIMVNGQTISVERTPLWSNARVLVPARSVFQKMGAAVDWNAGNKLVVVKKGSTVIQMKVGDKQAKLGNSSVKMDAAPVLSSGTVMVPVRFVAEALKSSVNWDSRSRTVSISYQQDQAKPATSSRGEEDNSGYIVVVDPGHGGYESGAVYGGVYEKDLNLAIAQKLNDLLKAEGVKTYMTRNDDTYVGLYERSDLANKVKADLLISVHNNADGYSGVKGTMSLYYPNGGNSNGKLTASMFASIVQKKLTGSLGSANLSTIARPHLAVLRTAYMPAVIAEVGYMTNSGELQKLKSRDYQQNAAEALKEAVMEALGKIK